GDPQEGDPQQGDPQEGDPQQGDPQEGDPQQGDPQEGETPSGDPNEMEKPDLGEGKDENTVPVEGAGDMPDTESPEGMPGQENQQDQDAQDGQDNKSDEQKLQDAMDKLDEMSDQLQEAMDQAGDNQGLQDLKDKLEEMKEELKEHMPEDKDSQDQDGQDQDGQDQDGQDGDGQTVEDLQKQLDQKEAEEAAQEGQDADGDGDPSQGDPSQGDPSDGKPQPSDQGGEGEGQDLSELSKQDWTDYRQRISELRKPISRIRKLFKAVQERQVQIKQQRSRSLEIFPENGEVMDRFNIEAHKQLTMKKAMKDVEENDLKRFHANQTHEVPTEIDIVIMIDGSGSMQGVPLNSALQAAAILHEAASGRDMHMNVYVGMWGNSNPPMIIKPGMNAKQIGQAMQSAKSGLHSGTDLAPAIGVIAETIADQRGKTETMSGFTHVLILSDGDIFDVKPSEDKIKTLFKYCDRVTIDTAVLKGRAGSSIENAVKNIKTAKKHQEIGVALETDPNKIPDAIVKLLLDKVRKSGSFRAVPNSQKRRAMKKAANKMGRRK
ncbi:MAG: hypothetical protein JKY27_14145, partial [Magnetovibrio sp.]|nr:hypothetical protein [Magnetovibrio sp.]